MLKKIGIGLAVLLVLIAGAVWYLFSNLDSLIKTAIETYGSAATQSQVGVDSVKLSISSGEGTISGLDVGNPAGFTSPNALTLGAISVQVDTSSLAGNGPIVIKTIDIEQPQVTYEVAGGVGLTGISTKTNLSVLQYNVQSYAGGPSSAAPPQSNGKPARKEIIDDLYISGGQVSVIAAALNGKGLSVPLPPIHLTGIGAGSSGATPGEIASQILSAVTHEATQVGSSALTQQVRSLATGALQGAGGVAGGALQGVGGTAGGSLGKVKSLF